MRSRERANAAAQEACERAGLQFLDGTAAFSRLRLLRDGGHLFFKRTYVFDYTAPTIERLQGFVILHGHRVESVGFAAQSHATAAQRVEPTVVNAPLPEVRKDNVLDLEEWRRQRQRTGSSDHVRRSEPGDRLG